MTSRYTHSRFYDLAAAVQSLPIPTVGLDTKTPTLTALICNYNHGKYLSRAIEAMLSQSRPADEFIIIDDASTDDSVSVIRSWVERYPSIRFLQNERNMGIHASFHTAEYGYLL